jgi:ketopantoate hydroxymethyltransferase
MPTQITQVEDVERGKTILRVEGEMMYDDAVLLEKIALECARKAAKLTLDFADLDFLDSESAPSSSASNANTVLKSKASNFFCNQSSTKPKNVTDN